MTIVGSYLELSGVACDRNLSNLFPKSMTDGGGQRPIKEQIIADSETEEHRKEVKRRVSFKFLVR